MSSSHGNKGEKDKDKENLDNLMFLSNAYIAQKGMMQAQYLLALGYYHAGNPKEAERWAKKVLETAKKDNDADNIKIVNHLLDEIKNK